MRENKKFTFLFFSNAVQAILYKTKEQSKVDWEEGKYCHLSSVGRATVL